MYNQGDRYPNDRATWDAILTELMPERKVWGYSNDDMHTTAQLGRNYSVMLLPELSADWVRRGLEQGRSWFVYNPEVSASIAAPVIESIRVDPSLGLIKIHASGSHETVWISDGAEIHRGDQIDLLAQPRLGPYVRAELRGENGIMVGTQPFGISRPVLISLSIAAAPGAVDYAADGQLRAAVQLRNLSDRALEAELDLRLDDQSLLRQPVPVAPGATTEVPLTLPVSALNSGRALVAKIDLGSTYGNLRRYPTLLPLEVELPVSVEIDAPSLRYARIQLHSRLVDRELPVEMIATVEGQEPDSQTLQIPAGGATETRVPLPQDRVGQTTRIAVSVRWAPEVGPTAGRFSEELNFQDTTRVPRRPALVEDAAADWGEPLLTLDTPDTIAPAHRRERWQGPGDASVELQWFWAGDDLWLAAEVRDDHHANTRDGGNIRNGDALQLSIAPIGVEAFNLTLALTDNGMQFHQSQGQELSLTAQSDYSVVRDDDTNLTRYRLRLPLAALGLKPEPGVRFGLNAIFFDDDDGTSYDYWLQMTPGLAGGWAPEHFQRFALGE